MTRILRALETKISLLVLITFAVGTADLLRGGITISAIALTLAYCVFVPLWIIRVPRGGPGEASGEKPEYLAAAICAAVVLVLYLVTLSPDTAMWDASEYIAAAFTFGLPHPPGNPFFVIVGRAFSVLPLPMGIGARINVLAAFSSAVAAAMWFLITERVLAAWLAARWQRIAGATAAALIGATAFTVWNQSVVNEKVYTISLTGIAIVSWLMLRWLGSPRSPRADRLLILVVYLCGLGYANHMAGMLPAFAIGCAILVRDFRAVLRPGLIAACAGALVLGLSPFLTQPIRAAHNPAINEGGISACRERFEIGCTLSAETADRFLYNFNRGQYGKPSLAERQASFGAQLDMYWLYFKWQWLRDPFAQNARAQQMLAAVFLLLGLMGAAVHARRHRESFLYFGPLMFTMTVVLVYYLNFKYGASQSPELGNSVPREVRDRDYFFLWSFSAWGVWAGIGLAYAWSSLATLLAPGRQVIGKVGPHITPASLLLRTSPVLLLALVPLAANFSAAARNGDRVTSSWARDLLNSVEPYGILIVAGDNDTFPLWYAQEVEQVRRDVIVATTSLLRTDWHARQIIRRPDYDYDAARGPAVYRNSEWTKPTGSPLGMSIEEADAIPDYYPSDKALLFDANGIKATIDPRKLEYGVIKRDDLIVLQIIHSAWPRRPLYFSRSTGNYPETLGLAPYLLQQGLAWKLTIPGDSASIEGDTVKVDGLGRVDVARSLALWNDSFDAPGALVRLGRWVDEPSASIPTLLVAVCTELAWLEKMRGNDASSDALFTQALQLAKATSTPGLVEQLAAARPR